jgi:hypothetical protein
MDDVITELSKIDDATPQKESVIVDGIIETLKPIVQSTPTTIDDVIIRTLDVATDAWALWFWDWGVCKDRIEGSPKIRTSDRFAVSRARVIDLASIREFVLAVEHEDVGRTSRSVRLRDSLSLVVEVRESVPLRGRFFFHHFRRVIRMGFDVVGADTHEVDALGFVICVESDEFMSDMFDERAVVADEHHYQGFAARYVFEGDGRSVNVWKFE